MYLRKCLSAWLLTLKVIVDKGRPKFQGKKYETAMAYKNEKEKYTVDTTCQNVSCFLL